MGTRFIHQSCVLFRLWLRLTIILCSGHIPQKFCSQWNAQIITKTSQLNMDTTCIFSGEKSFIQNALVAAHACTITTIIHMSKLLDFVLKVFKHSVSAFADCQISNTTSLWQIQPLVLL